MQCAALRFTIETAGCLCPSFEKSNLFSVTIREVEAVKLSLVDAYGVALVPAEITEAGGVWQPASKLSADLPPAFALLRFNVPTRHVILLMHRTTRSRRAPVRQP